MKERHGLLEDIHMMVDKMWEHTVEENGEPVDACMLMSFRIDDGSFRTWNLRRRVDEPVAPEHLAALMGVWKRCFDELSQADREDLAKAFSDMGQEDG